MRRTLVMAAVLATPLVPAFAQATSSVAPSDPAYADLQRLIDAGLVVDAGAGHRPYSRREMSRLALAADSALHAASAESAGAARANRAAVDRLLQRFGREGSRVRDGRGVGLVGRVFATSTAQALYTTARARAVQGNGLGIIEADIAPLTDYREGRRFVPGANVAHESEHWARLGSHLAVQARPRVHGVLPRRGDADAAIDLVTGNARFVARGVALTVGRELTEWSYAPGGGLFFSQNAPGLNLVRLASETPFRLPSFLGRLGPTSGTLQIADLGPSDSNSHSLLVAYKASVTPVPALTMGATFANHFGGAGAVNPSLSRRVIDLIPLIDIFRRHEDSTEFDSDKLLGLDARLRLARLGGVTAYAELSIEDFDVNRVGSVLTEDAAWIGGLIVPSVGGSPVSVHASYHRTGLRFYQHHAVRNGYAASRFTLGDNLGRDARGWYGTLGWDRGGAAELRLHTAVERRGNDTYEGRYTEPNSQGFRFFRLTEAPPERRVRGAVELRARERAGSRLMSVAAGLERVRGPAGFGIGNATQGLLEASISLFR